MRKRSFFDQAVLRSGKRQKTVVVNCTRSECDVRIDRSSKWGNPFIIGPDGDRAQVIEKYRQWIITQPHLMDSLHELRGKRLGCWCVPDQCHGYVLIDLLKERFGDDP